MTHWGKRFLLTTLGLALLGLVACVSPPPRTEGFPNQTAMVGKTKEKLFACAGTPLREVKEDEWTILKYYREAPMLEESSVASKGSSSGIHHGCWAMVVLVENKVTEVRYQFTPAFIDSSNDCEEIFDQCVP